MRSKMFRRAGLLMLLLPAVGLAWGSVGHRMVADMAARHLTPEARAQISRLLEPSRSGGRAPKVSIPQDREQSSPTYKQQTLLTSQSLTDVATWADEVRNQRRYRWSAPLHYVNVQPQAESFDWQRDCPDGQCVVGAIARFAAVLRDPRSTDAQKTEALKFLIHFVGDVHQPLHVSRACDRGGNDIAVEFFHHRSNLHEVWDMLIIQHAQKPWPEYARELEAGISDEQRQAWARLDPCVWATESWKLALSNAYAVPKDGQLGDEYFQTNLPVVERRLQMAGVRLAALLNAVFGDGQGLAQMAALTATRPAAAPAATQPASAPASSTQPS